MNRVQSKEKKMLRRDFLKFTSAAAALALIPTSSFAESYTGPLWVFVQATGGWDPTSFCDPKGYNEVDDGNGGVEMESNPMNQSYRKADIATSTSASSIKYAPISGADDNGVQYAFSTFFDTYGKDLLIINGVDSQTNGHDTGRRYFMSGRLSEGYPALSALIAGVNIPSSPLAFITAGGYDETDGVVAGTRLSNVSAFNELAFVNKRGDETYVSDATFSRILKAKQERISRVTSKAKLERVKALATQYGLAHSGSNELQKLVENMPEDIDTHPDRNNAVFAQGRFAMAGYKAGLTSSVNIAKGGFDTHGNHDGSHIPQLARLLKGIDLLKQEAVNQGIADRVIFVVGSDFGRTPGYNGGNGKDHWSVTSAMFMGPGIKGGRVIGASTDRHEHMTVNPTSLALDNSGIKITYAHINKALRKLSGLEGNTFVEQYYPLDNELEDLPLFT